MSRLRSVVGQPLALFVVTSVLSACGDYTIPLPNGYFLARVHSGAFSVVNPQNHGVTDVSRQGIALKVVGNVVAGEIDPPSSGEAPSATQRYFVVNTRTGEAWVDLSFASYRQKLRDLGISALPRLVRVNRFTTDRSLRTAV